MKDFFIGVYRVVTSPFRLFNKKETSTNNNYESNNIEQPRQNQFIDKNIESLPGQDEISKNTNGMISESELKRITFDYEVINSYGQTIKSSFDALSESEVRAFLVNEGYKIVSITPRNKYNFDINLPGANKMNTSDLTFALTQLSTYIKAGISLIDSVRILAKQTADTKKKKVYERIVYDLVTGEDFSKALENQNDVFPKLLINMVKTAEMTGDLPTVLDEMSEYYKDIEQTRKQMISAMIYPSFIFIFSIIVVAFCLIWVVPSFVGMYASSGSALPAITQITINVSNFLANNYLIIILVVLTIVIAYKIAYKNIKSFRKAMQTIYMKMPIIGNIIIYNEVTMFTKTFASLINHNVNIQQTMEVLSKITDNEIYKEIITNTIDTLQSGGKISESFRGNWAFPIVAYEMLVTGESTGQLGLMMEKVSEHFSSLHKNAVNTMKSLVEPITIVFLAVAVGFILISMFIPMFGVYSTIQ